MRLPLLPVDFLTGTVAKDDLIKGNLTCRDLMDEARDYHLHISNKVVPDFEYSDRTVARKYTAGACYTLLCVLLRFGAVVKSNAIICFRGFVLCGRTRGFW